MLANLSNADLQTWALVGTALLLAVYIAVQLITWVGFLNFGCELTVLLCSMACLALRRPLNKEKPSADFPKKQFRREHVPSQRKRETATSETCMRSRMNQAIHRAAQTGKRKQAEQLLADMERAGIDPDSNTYNSLIHACAKCGDIQGAEDWLAQMQSRGAAATVYTYNILMDVCAKADDASAAEVWMERMHADGLAGNEVSYSTVIHAHARLGNIEQARSWLEKMVKKGVQPNIVTYNSLIHAYSRAGDAEGAEGILNEVLEVGCTPLVTTYTAIIDACTKSADMPRAEKIMTTMMRNGVEPNVVSYSAMIDVCAKAGDPDSADRWFDAMLHAGVKPNIVSFNSLIAADASDLKRCRQIFLRMEAEGLSPNIISFTCLATPLAHKGDWDSVEALHEELRNRGITINDYFLYMLLTAYAKARPRQSERATATFRACVAEGVKPNKHVIQALGRAVGPVQAQKLLAGGPQAWPLQ